MACDNSQTEAQLNVGYAETAASASAKQEIISTPLNVLREFKGIG
jgi:hypothetical protein